MSKARAAQIWAQLERLLIERCGLPNGRMLDVERPNLIRRIGSALTGKSILPDHGRAAAVKSVSPPLPVQTVVKRQFRLIPANSGNDTIHDPRLAAMLERSCSRRMGYDGDDPVGYGDR
jgi:hypothetical protein